MGYKTDFGKLYPDPPKLQIDDADVFLDQIDGIIGDYDKIRTGESMFDAERFIYEPQKALLDREYGIGTQAGDTFGAKSGALQELQNNLNKRGLLDAGTSGLLESQVYADRNRQLAELFGNAKQVQRDDFFNSLTNLERLFPQRFEVRNIPNTVNYFNDTNQFNQASARNFATEGDRLQRKAEKAGQWASLFGGLGESTLGNMVGGYFENKANGLNSRAASLFGGASSGGFGGGSSGGGGNFLGGLTSMFGGGNKQTVQPNAVNTGTGSPFQNYYGAPGGQGNSNANTFIAPSSQNASLAGKGTPGFGDFFSSFGGGGSGGFSGGSADMVGTLLKLFAGGA